MVIVVSSANGILSNMSYQIVLFCIVAKRVLKCHILRVLCYCLVASTTLTERIPFAHNYEYSPFSYLDHSFRRLWLGFWLLRAPLRRIRKHREAQVHHSLSANGAHRDRELTVPVVLYPGTHSTISKLHSCMCLTT